MKIVFVISSLRAGGAERVMSILANKWASDGHQVSFITLDSSDSDFYALDHSVSRMALGLASSSPGLLKAILENYKRLSALRFSIKKFNPDVVLAFTDATNILTALACVGSGYPVVVSERINPFKSSIGRIRNLIRPIIYNCLTKYVVVQTESLLLECQMRWPGVRIKSIPNPIGLKSFSEHKASKKILSVGRLVNQKAHELTISAFARIARNFPEWRLEIAGEGGLHDELQNTINYYGMESRISLLGRVENIQKLYSDAEIFCLASRYEGFPNVLLEALASGCSCVATDCESGPREILENGRLGILTPVDDVDALADALQKLIQDPELRRQYGSHSDYVRSRYKLESISQQWLDLFSQVKK